MPFVDALVMIGGGRASAARAGRAGAADKPLFRARLQADAIAASGLIGRPVLAFAGIANPEKFFATLAGVGAQVAETAVFPDHWRFRPAEIERLVSARGAQGTDPGLHREGSRAVAAGMPPKRARRFR